MSEFSIYINALTGPLMLMLVFSRDLAYLPIILRIGFGMIAVGITAQSIIMTSTVDCYDGVGNLWMLEDIGFAIVCLTWTGLAIVNRVKKAEQVTIKRVLRARGIDGGE